MTRVIAVVKHTPPWTRRCVCACASTRARCRLDGDDSSAVYWCYTTSLLAPTAPRLSLTSISLCKYLTVITQIQWTQELWMC